MKLTKENWKMIGGGLVVLAAASLMLQPLLVYLAGIGRMISFIISAILIAYLITFAVVKLRGKPPAATGNRGGDAASEQGDVEV